jgi:hypothetical protein
VTLGLDILLLDTTLATSRKRLMPTDWMARQPGNPIDPGLAVLASQGALRVNSRRGTGRRTYTDGSG